MFVQEDIEMQMTLLPTISVQNMVPLQEKRTRLSLADSISRWCLKY